MHLPHVWCDCALSMSTSDGSKTLIFEGTGADDAGRDCSPSESAHSAIRPLDAFASGRFRTSPSASSAPSASSDVASATVASTARLRVLCT
eukprot:CAMPEP_0179845108 /NCGR_PEP_ID=MMETSP0982-20121206/4732_1 /TAXON_ID=483367 /ORGANISM="non described non described, Strain CCMP 2436" /LENGTH=90 /DNA_ID=CAMNT_0021729921 /DNA_START=743 /DNA_END=1011 /DNA_ORIENTATION=+